MIKKSKKLALTATAVSLSMIMALSTVYAASVEVVSDEATDYTGVAATAASDAVKSYDADDDEIIVEEITVPQYAETSPTDIQSGAAEVNKIATGVVSVNTSSLTLGAGESYDLVSKISDTDNAEQSVYWSSSDEQIAAVDENGEVTAVNPGSAVITAALQNGSNASCTVTVKKAPTSVKLSTGDFKLGVGESCIIKQASPSDCYAREFEFTSSNKSVATVEKTTANKAEVVAKGVGTTTITVKTYNGQTASCTVTVKKAPTSVKLNTSKVTLGVGESYTISQSSPSDCYAKGFEFTSSNKSVAIVEKTTANKAKVVAKGVGTAKITVKTYNGKTATCTVTVKKAPTSVKLNTGDFKLGVGESCTIKQNSPSDCYANGFEFTSSNKSVATVEKTTANKAKVVAKGVGTAKITVKTYNGKTATCTVTVKKAPTSVKLSKTSLEINKGSSYTISQSSPSDCYARGFEFTSSNTSVATVEKTTANKAKIVAKKAGTAKITVKTYNGKTATCTVKVKERSYTDDDLYCIAAVIWQESGSYWISDKTQLMVGNVVLNRVASSAFPNTIRGVLSQPYQYGPMAYSITIPKATNKIMADAIDRCYENARRLLEGERVLPSNVVFQANFTQGSGVYAYSDGLYFCYR